jgi:pyroglutamyl-peptidase
MNKILVTAFEPFGGDPVNPTMEILEGLANVIEGHEVIKVVLPVVFGEDLQSKLNAAIEEHKPTHVFNMGLAAGRFEISLERVAINLDDGRIADNNGFQPIDNVIKIDGENAYFTNMPVKAMNQAVQKAGIPCVVSYTAGTYVCNHTMYNLLYYITKNNLNTKGIFIHVPYMSKQVIGMRSMPSLSLDQMIEGITIAITTALTTTEDISVVGGNVC